MQGLYTRLRERNVRTRLVFIREHDDAIRTRGSWHLRASQNARDSAALMRILLRERPSVIVTFTPLMGAIAAIVGRLMWNATCIATHHTPSGRQSRIARWLDAVAGEMGAFDTIVACSPAVMESLQRRSRRYRERMTMIVNGVAAVRQTRNADAALDVRKSLNIQRAESVAFSAGSLTENKNHVVVVRALEHLPHWHLVIAGDGEMRERLRASAKSLGVDRRLHLLGSVPHRVVSNWLASCDAYVQPSKVEGLSLALLEAMAHGAPCIAADIAENRAPLSIGDQLAGHLLPPDDPARWAQKLSWVRTHPLDAAAMGARARDVQRARFDQEEMYAAYLRVILGGHEK